jgi:hypothetical protein
MKRFLNSVAKWFTEESQARRPQRFRPSLEVLEDRRVLSTITWTNRGSSATDSDGFGAVFGAQADTARAVVDAAVQSWQNVIQNFNYASGQNNFDLTLETNPANRSNGASAGFNSAWDDASGKGMQGDIKLGVGSDGHGAGYFLDPTPNESTEFQGGLANAYAAKATPGGPAAGRSDLFSVVVLELTHEMGLSPDGHQSFQKDAHHYLKNTGKADPNHPGTLFTFTGPGVNALFTSDDGGSPRNPTVAIHTAEPGASYTDPATGITYVGLNDSDNAYYQPGQRLLPSKMDATILADDYGYTINTPVSFADQAAARAPTSPGPLVATAVTSTQLDLSWAAATGADGYRLYSWDGSSWQLFASLGANVTKTPVTGLTAGTTYYFLVEAYNAVGSTDADWIQVTTLASASAPTSPGPLVATAVTSTQLDLSWTAATGADGYRLYYWDGSSWQLFASLGANVTKTPVTRLTAGATYYFLVEAFNAVGSSDADWIQVTTLG